MNQKFPGCSIIAKHIENKMKKLKEKYVTTVNVMNQPGFGWSDTNKCVIVDSNDILEAYLKKNPKNQNIVGKAFPLFDRLQFVFGKDRMTGAAAIVPADVVEELDHQEEIGGGNIEHDVPLSSPSSVGASSAASQSNVQSKRKRARDSDRFDKFIEAFQRASAAGNDITQVIAKLDINASRLHEIVSWDAKARIAGELQKMDLTEDEQIEAGIKLMDHTEYVHLFWGFTGRQREALVRRLIR
ncbi:uncharacterized protein LOC131163811 [Malania oleifera]|uniref:uncharacterized protein LOC131163811 n=1 Tax=Malania oleifera TaxID=397392 RepID=UPI0025AE2EEA|nr:uncharacterized protein LOC131163811 [Malania oleifera]